MDEEYSLDEVAAEYASTLKDLVCNSKPLISTLTMLADDYQVHSKTIVEVIERHINEAPRESKLPGLYLIDSICKNIGGAYIPAFSTNIVSLFSSVFEKVDEATRAQMYKLRMTWTGLFSNVKLHMIDRRVHGIDSAWPVADASSTRTSAPDASVTTQPAAPARTQPAAPVRTQPAAPARTLPVVSRTVHVNPNVIKVQEPSEVDLASTVAKPNIMITRSVPDLSSSDIEEIRMRTHLLQKKKELYELQAQTLALELGTVQKKFEEFTKTFLANNPGARLDSDPRFQMEKINTKIKVESIQLQQITNAEQLGEVTDELLSLGSLPLNGSTATQSTATRTPVASVSRTQSLTLPSVTPVLTVQPPVQPRVMTVTPMQKSEKEQKRTTETPPVAERGSRDPRKNRAAAAVPPRVEAEVQPTPAPKPLVPTSPVKKSVVSDVSSKDPRKRMSATKSKDVTKVDEIQVHVAKESSPKLAVRQKSPARATPPTVKTESPVRATSPPRSKSKPRASPPRRESPPRKEKRKGGKKDRQTEESPMDKKVKLETSDERRRKESTPGEEEKMSKGKDRSEPVQEVQRPVSSVDNHGDVDLRTSTIIPPVISLPKPVSPVPEESDMGLFGTEDTDLRVLPSLVQKLAAAIRQKKEAPAKEPVEPVPEGVEALPIPHDSAIDRLAAALKRSKDAAPEEPDIPVPPPPILPKKVEEKIEAPPPPKLPKIPKKAKTDVEEKDSIVLEEKRKPKEQDEKRKRKDEKSRRSPKRKRERSPGPSRSPPRKRERERSPLSVQPVRSPLLEWDNRSRSPILRPYAGESPTRRRGWKDIKEKQEEKRGHELDRRRDRDRELGERISGREREPITERDRRETATERERRERELIGEKGVGREREPLGVREREPIGDRGVRGPGLRSTIFRGPERQRGRGGRDRGGGRFREGDESADFIIEEAEAQLNSGFISKRQFTEIVNDVMKRRESRLLREAQRRDGFLHPVHPNMAPGPMPRGPRPMHPRPLIEPLIGPRPLIDLPPVQAMPGFGPRPLLEPPKLPEESLEHNVINIDGIPREVRFYGEIAVALMAPNEPRELSFCREDLPRAIRVDGQIVGETVVGDGYKEMFFGGRPHMVRIGAPTRELFVDGKGYEYTFEGPDKAVTIDGRLHMIGVSGPRPQVCFGTELRTDLIAGKTEMILNGEKIIPVYLDALEHKFEIRGVIHTLRFENSLQTVLFDGVPYFPNFGGLPVRVELEGETQAHYARFLSLPEGVVPGQVSIVGMKSEPILLPPAVREHIPEQPLPPPSPSLRKLDRIASTMAIAHANSRIAPAYSVDSFAPAPAPEPVGVNVHALFSRLLATGLLDQAEKAEPKLDEVKSAEENLAKAEVDAINSVILQIDNLRVRRQPIIEMLYKGVQCNSCGLRFPADKACQYSQHLDWHFRQNRREKAYGKKPQSRPWHYTTADWCKFEEFGEERGWFEGGEVSDGESVPSSPEPELPTVPADSENPELNQCAVCREEIPQFFDEELEEWRLRNAVREDAKTFHSSCYEDFKSHGEPGLFPGLDLPVEEEEAEAAKEESKAETEKPDSVKEEIKEETVIKEEPPEEQTEIKVEQEEKEMKVKSPTPPTEESVETNPPTPVIDELSVKVEERDISTPVEDEKTIEVSSVVDIVETSERIVSSLDGNLEMSESISSLVQVSKIKFNISAPSMKQKEPEKVEVEAHTTWKRKEIEVSETPAESDEAPPGEEPTVSLKPRMMGRKFKQMPVVAKGREESGLCTIM